MHDSFAHVGGLLATRLRDLTTDLAALDSAGWWAVVVDYEGKVTCARFDDVRPAPLPQAGPWIGPGAWHSSLDQAAYERGVQRIRDYIEQGEVYQANLCRVLSAPLPASADPLALAHRLRRGNPAAYAAVIDVPGTSVVSASPELYLSRDGDVVESRPIKGTGVTADDLLDKDYAENVMIVDLVRNDLGRVAEVGSVTVPALYHVEDYPARCTWSRPSGPGWPRGWDGPSCSPPPSLPARSPAPRNLRPCASSMSSNPSRAGRTVGPWAGSTPTGARRRWPSGSAPSGSPQARSASAQERASPGAATLAASGARPS